MLNDRENILSALREKPLRSAWPTPVDLRGATAADGRLTWAPECEGGQWLLARAADGREVLLREVIWQTRAEPGEVELVLPAGRPLAVSVRSRAGTPAPGLRVTVRYDLAPAVSVSPIPV